MATQDITPEAAPVTPHRTPAQVKYWREIYVAILEEHLSALEHAALVVAHATERQRYVLGRLKAQEGWDWDIPSPSALFGDAVLFRDCAVRVVARDEAGEA